MMFGKADFGLDFIACLVANAEIEAAQRACEDEGGAIISLARWDMLNAQRLANAERMADCVLDLIAHTARAGR